MKFTILGSCSGTEAMPDRRHTAVLLESGDKLYLLDAGDNCAYAMTMLGYDVSKLTAVFISHPHFDHVGGLPFLFFQLYKLIEHAWAPLKQFDVYSPSADVVSASLLLRQFSCVQDRDIKGAVVTHPIADGLVYDDGVLKLTALHNAHLGETQPPYHSFSFLLEIEGKKIVYSGDVKHVKEMEAWFDCDLMMTETGHHDAEAVAKYIKDAAAQPKKLLYVHHGRTMMQDTEGYLKKARALLGENVDAAYDGMTFEL